MSDTLNIGDRAKVVPTGWCGEVVGIDAIRETVLVQIDEEDHKFEPKNAHRSHNVGEWRYCDVVGENVEVEQ